MEIVRKIETALQKLFKDAPTLSKGSRSFLVAVLPWAAVVLGLLELFGAWDLWSVIGTYADIGEYSAYYIRPPESISSNERLFMYVGVAMLFVNAVILLMAYPELKARTRRGWDLLFLAALINAVYAFFSLAIQGRGAGTFVLSSIVSIFGFYLLFQVKDAYKASQKPPSEQPGL